MLQLIERAAAPAQDAVLRSMFAARKRVFVDLLKWDVPVIAGAYEIDQFDSADASYLILVDGNGDHLGSARLLPTERPHLLDTLVSSLCAGGAPKDPAIYEITRFCLDRRLKATERRAVRDALVTGLVDHALAQGIRAYTAIAEMGWFQQILAFGWRCRPLGLPQPHDGAVIAALRVDIGPETPALLAAAGVIAPRRDAGLRVRIAA